MKHHLSRLAIGFVAAAAVTVGCSSSEPSDAVPTPSTVASASPTTSSAPVLIDREPLIEGVALVVLLGPGDSTSEAAPEFSWEAIDGAATYRLAVIGNDGPIWSWEGTPTAVRLGGFTEERPAGFPGPSIDRAASWSVVALDADGNVVAASDLRPIEAVAP